MKKLKILLNKRIWIAMGVIIFLCLYAYFWNNYDVKGPTKTSYDVKWFKVTIEWKCFICKINKDQVATVSAQVIQETQTVVALKPIVTEKDYALSKPHGKLLWYGIFERESNKGVYDVCRQKGIGYNGMGFGESDEYIKAHGPNCLKTYQALWDGSEKLIVDLGIDLPDNEQRAICRWKYGSDYNEPMCNYSKEVKGFMVGL